MTEIYIFILIAVLFFCFFKLYKKIKFVSQKVALISELTEDEIKRIVNNNISQFHYELNTAGKYYNENLSDELNDFFNTYQLIEVGDDHFGHKFIKSFEESEDYTQIGIDTYFEMDRFDNALVVKNNSNEILHTDDENGLSIYEWMLNELLCTNHFKTNNIDQLKEIIKKELAA